MSDINTLIVDRYDEWITIWDGDKIVFKGICDNINVINKVKENYSATATGDKSTYIFGSSSIEGKIKISTKDNDVNLLLDCIRQNKKLTLHYRDNDNAVCVVPFSGYNYYNNVFFYDTFHIINFFAKEILVYPDDDYRKKFVPYNEYENKEDIEELEKTLLTNDYILQPLTQSTTATISTGGFMDNSVCTAGFTESSICTAYDTNLHIDCPSVTFGEIKFNTKEVGAALKRLVDDYKTKELTEKSEITNNKEDKNMFNKIFNKYKFGKLDTKDIAYSMNGVAFRTSDGSYVVYNKDLTFTNVDNLVMDIPVFVMPVALSEIKPGDVIVHYGVGSTAFVIVNSINDTDIFISDPHTRERKNLIPEKSIFGFDFVAKVMTPNTMFAADQSNPFGNMLPFMLMGEDANTDNLSFMMLFGQCCGEASWANQYLPLMFMDKGDNDMFKYMALMQMMNQNKETK